MSYGRLTLRGAVVVIASSCVASGPAHRDRSDGSAALSATPATPTPAASASSIPAIASAALAVAEARSTQGGAVPEGIEQVLDRARIVELTPAAGASRASGIFDAVLDDQGADATVTTSGPTVAVRYIATLALVLRNGPLSYRRSLACYRLARALGMRVVAPMIERRFGAGEIAALLDRRPEALDLLRREASTANDGTIAVLLRAPLPSAAPSPLPRDSVRAVVDPKSSREARLWATWASSPAPVSGEDASLARDFVEMLALDYLTGNGARTAVRIAGGRLVLDDNREAFPLHVERSSGDHLLRRLRAVARFPRGLLASLGSFDRARAVAVLAPGAFDTWLVSPRTLIELDERRAALLSLIETKVVERDREGVLSL